MEERQTDYVNEKLAEINSLIAPYQLAWVHPETDCVPLKRNARYMTKEQQDRLTDNVKNDGFLSQLPFGIRQSDGKYKVISGNHRIKSAIKAGLERVLILYGTETDFDEQRQLAIQLSHNAISGQDDLAMLRDLYSELEDVTMKAYSGIDEKFVMDYKALDFVSISEKDIELNEINFVFCDPNRHRVEKILEILDGISIDKNTDAIIIGDVDRFIDVLTRVKNRYDIKNRSVALLKMIGICEDFLKLELQEASPCK